LKADTFDSSVEALNHVVGSVTHHRLGVLSRGGGGLDALIGFRSAAAVRAADPLRGAAISVRVFLDARDSFDPGASLMTGYDYALLDRDGVELLAYHGHPGRGGLGPDAPHVHVSAALRPGRASGNPAILPLDKRHLLTGPVALAGFLGMLVGEFGVAPLAADWRTRLAPPAP
jgi:hypothetical protein